MIHKDYVMRLIEMFINTLLEVLGLKEKDPERALDSINKLLMQLTGFSSKFINSVSESKLLELLETKAGIDADRIIMTASLLKEEADIYEVSGNLSESFPRYLKALSLYLEVINRGCEIHVPAQYIYTDEIISKLKLFQLPAHTIIKAAVYFERKQMYSLAEDMLYDFIKLESYSEAAVKLGIEFYERMLAREDGDLNNGNLPRNEVIHGLSELKKQLK